MSTKAKIFIVEDSTDTVLTLEIYLNKSFDCELTFARMGNAAIEVLEHQKNFDVIICDFMMDPGTGVDVLNFMTANKIKIPFIFYSGHASELQSYKSEICVAVIDKTKVEKLTATVGRLIGQEAC